MLSSSDAFGIEHALLVKIILEDFIGVVFNEVTP